MKIRHGRPGKFNMLSDFVVIGGGIIGITIARELKRRFKDCNVNLIEKENGCAEHASGRNSGVLHAGFYYTADSLKAQFTRDGCREMTEYCETHDIPINKCGKLVVAKNASELASLDELLNRAKHNGVVLQPVSADDAKSIEPRAITYERALFSPNTASVNPLSVVKSMEQQARNEGITFNYGERYHKRGNKGEIITSSGKLFAGYIVNAAGLYADKIAKDFNFSERYSILPFKGLYLYSNEPRGAIRTNIYPVPDLQNPFLGVHFTVTADNDVKIGPTAIPAFWREHYKGFENFKLGEFAEIIIREMNLFAFSNFGFTKLAYEEMKKHSRKYMVSLAAQLADGMHASNFTRWGKPGIRAQLVDLRERKLEMDFVVEGDDSSMHVLNAVSPAFTCSLPFSRYVCDLISNEIK
jgi:L-2-hydroxyglutarate oxidase LhgO